MRKPLVMSRWWVVILTAALLVAGGATQARAQAGWYYLPDLTLSEVFDDNIFGTSASRQSDFISRLSSAVKVGYRSAPLTFLATSAFDAEAFAKNPDNDGLNRVQSGVEAQWRPMPRLTLRFDGAFTRTETPSELVNGLGLELGRQTSTDLSVTPALSYRIQRTTLLEGSYGYHRTETGDVTTTTQEPRLRLTEQLTRVDLGTLTYGYRLIESSNSSVSSHLVLVGWGRQISRSTTLILEAGPRISTDGSLDAEANATLSHRWPSSVETSITYSRAQITIPGQTGPSNTQVVTAQVSMIPIRSMTVSLTASGSMVSQGSSDTTTEGVGLAVTYRITKWLSAVGVYRFNHSETRGVSTDHSVVSIGLQARYPTRLDD